eukprot:SM000018S03713  [mRNA]  locus=s18:944880:955796:- [translate_table: standard]
MAGRCRCAWPPAADSSCVTAQRRGPLNQPYHHTACIGLTAQDPAVPSMQLQCANLHSTRCFDVRLIAELCGRSRRSRKGASACEQLALVVKAAAAKQQLWRESPSLSVAGVSHWAGLVVEVAAALAGDGGGAAPSGPAGAGGRDAQVAALRRNERANEVDWRLREAREEGVAPPVLAEARRQPHHVLVEHVQVLVPLRACQERHHVPLRSPGSGAGRQPEPRGLLRLRELGRNDQRRSSAPELGARVHLQRMGNVDGDVVADIGGGGGARRVQRDAVLELDGLQRREMRREARREGGEPHTGLAAKELPEWPVAGDGGGVAGVLQPAETALELLAVVGGTLQSIAEQPVFGSIRDLRVLPFCEPAAAGRSPALQGKDLLVLLSDSGKLSFLAFNIEAHRFLAISHVGIAEPGFDRHSLGRLLAVEPTYELALPAVPSCAMAAAHLAGACRAVPPPTSATNAGGGGDACGAFRGRAVAVAAFEDRVGIFPATPQAKDRIVEKGVVYSGELGLPEAAWRAEPALAHVAGAADSAPPPRWGTIWSMAFVGPQRDGGAATALRGGLGNEVELLAYDARLQVVCRLARFPLAPSRGEPLVTTLLQAPPPPAAPEGALLLACAGALVLLDCSDPASPHFVSTVPLLAGCGDQETAESSEDAERRCSGMSAGTSAVAGSCPADAMAAAEGGSRLKKGKEQAGRGEERPGRLPPRHDRHGGAAAQAVGGASRGCGGEQGALRYARWLLQQLGEEGGGSGREEEEDPGEGRRGGEGYDDEAMLDEPGGCGDGVRTGNDLAGVHGTVEAGMEYLAFDLDSMFRQQHWDGMSSSPPPPPAHDAGPSGSEHTRLWQGAESSGKARRRRKDAVANGSGGGQEEDRPVLCAWSWEPGGGALVVGTDRGCLQMVAIEESHRGPKLVLGPCSRLQPMPSVLLWLPGGMVLAPGEMGDGALLAVRRDRRLARVEALHSIAPISDFVLVDYHNEKQDQMFAACGLGDGGSIRVVRNGIRVERLLSTPAVYEGMVGTWTLRMRREDTHHAFLVMSFVAETRVLSVGPTFNDISDHTGLHLGASTLACGRIRDGWLAQVSAHEVRLCRPTTEAHSAGWPGKVPCVTAWSPAAAVAPGACVSVGAVAEGFVLVALPQPRLLLMLAAELDSQPGGSGSPVVLRLVELRRCQVSAELSCISIPEEDYALAKRAAADGQAVDAFPPSSSSGSSLPSHDHQSPPSSIAANASPRLVCVTGTHHPSIQILSLAPGEEFGVLATASLRLKVTGGMALCGCVPESVRLAFFDRLYVLAGLRNGMLLRFEWPGAAPAPFAPASDHAASCGPSGKPPPVPRQPCNMTLLASAAETASSRTPWLASNGNAPSSEEARQQQGDGGEVETVDDAMDEDWPTDDPPTSLGSFNDKMDEDGGLLHDEAAAVLLLVAERRIGASPVSLVPLEASLRANIVALSDRPWLLQTARHSQRIATTSISFPPTAHATAVSCAECPRGLVLVSDRCLHLVEMEQSKRLNLQTLPLGATPRRLFFHDASNTLLVICSRTRSKEKLVNGCSTGKRIGNASLINSSDRRVSELWAIDPISGAVHASFTLEEGELAMSLQVWKQGAEQLVVVGTGFDVEPSVPLSGESGRGRLLIFHMESKHQARARVGVSGPGSEGPPALSTPAPDLDTARIWHQPESPVVGKGQSLAATCVSWQLVLQSSLQLPGAVACVAPYLGQYLLAAAGNYLFCFALQQPSDGVGPSSSSTTAEHVARAKNLHNSLAPNLTMQRLKRLACTRTRFPILTLDCHLARIAVGDCRDGILVYSYREDTGRLEQLLCDPQQRLVADCVMTRSEEAAAVDRSGRFVELCRPERGIAEEGCSPERNLSVACSYNMGEIALRIRKGSLAYRAPLEKEGEASSASLASVQPPSLVAGTMLGSVVLFLGLTRREYHLLKAVQERLVAFPLTAPLLGNNHARYRYYTPPGLSHANETLGVLDGDMLCQFLELTTHQQLAVLAGQPTMSLGHHAGGLLVGPELGGMGAVPVEQVLRLLERVQNSLA